MNKELNATPLHRGAKCENCGRSYPETVLDIGSVLKYRLPYHCLDRKTCNRVEREKRLKSGRLIKRPR